MQEVRSPNPPACTGICDLNKPEHDNIAVWNAARSWSISYSLKLCNSFFNRTNQSRLLTIMNQPTNSSSSSSSHHHNNSVMVISVAAHHLFKVREMAHLWMIYLLSFKRRKHKFVKYKQAKAESRKIENSCDGKLLDAEVKNWVAYKKNVYWKLLTILAVPYWLLINWLPIKQDYVCY